MTKKKHIVSMPDLLMLLNKHIEIFECANALLELQAITQKMVALDERPSDEEMEAFPALVSSISFIRDAATAFIKELKTKELITH